MGKGYHSHGTSALLLAMGLLVFTTACGPKHTKGTVTPATPSNTPNTGGGGDRPVIATFTVEPASIEMGQSVTLRWSVSNSTDVTIDQGVGAVQSQGSRQLSPRRSTTYTLTANGPGGTDSRSVNVTLSNPPPPPTNNPSGNNPTLSGAEILQAQAQDAFFDYDKNDLRQDARDAITHDAELLRRIFAQDPNFTVIIEGHCDERGSGEYNLALGDRRANAAHELLVQLGIPAARLKTISYGKERPQCTDATEECWQKNRRAHLAAGQ
jgi:peptidoglycan-associated lipoprotein